MEFRKFFLISLVVVIAITLGAAVLAMPQKQKKASPVESKNPEVVARIISISIEPSTADGGWIMYRDGAKARVEAQGLASVDIRYLPTGTGIGELYPNGESAGSALLEKTDGNGQVWSLKLPTYLLATNFWAEGKGRDGTVVKSRDLGNVGFDEKK